MTLDQKIRKARPNLRDILPVVMWCTVVFAVLNVFLAIGLFLWHPSNNSYPVVAPNQTMMTVWAILFGIIGLGLAHGLITKRWERLRGYMCVALCYKIFWSLALLVRIVDGGTLLIAVLFIGLAALQSVIIIFYLPPDEVNNERLP